MGVCSSEVADEHSVHLHHGGGHTDDITIISWTQTDRKIKCSFDLSYCLEFTVEAGRPDWHYMKN